MKMKMFKSVSIAVFLLACFPVFPDIMAKHKNLKKARDFLSHLAKKID